MKLFLILIFIEKFTQSTQTFSGQPTLKPISTVVTEIIGRLNEEINRNTEYFGKNKGNQGLFAQDHTAQFETTSKNE